MRGNDILWKMYDFGRKLVMYLEHRISLILDKAMTPISFESLDEVLGNAFKVNC